MTRLLSLNGPDLRRISIACLALVCGMIISHSAHAQRTPRLVHSGGSGGFIVGYGSHSLDAFNFFLPSPVSAPDNGLINFGGTGYVQLNDWLFGASGWGASGPESAVAEARTRYRAGMGFVQAGYMTHVDYRHKLYPMVGIGYGSAALNFTRNEALSAEIFPEEPFHETNVQYASMLLQLGLGGEWYIEGKDQADAARREASGYMIGMRLHYISGPGAGSGGWSYGGGDISGAPDHRIEVVQISLILGGGIYSY